jgi:hypothetical protein
MFDSFGSFAGNLLDPFGFRNSSNPIVAFLGNPLGILPTDDDDDDKKEKFDSRENWEQTKTQRLARGSLPTTGEEGFHQVFPDNVQIAKANALRGYGELPSKLPTHNRPWGPY